MNDNPHLKFTEDGLLSVPVLYPMSPERSAELRNLYTFHKVPGAEDRFALIRELTLQAAIVIEEICPPSRERALAQTALQEVRMWANAAIAIHEGEDRAAV